MLLIATGEIDVLGQSPYTHKVILQGKPEFTKWRTKFCPRYDEMEKIFGNDAATGDRAVSGFDHFSQMNGMQYILQYDTLIVFMYKLLISC